MLIIQVSGEIDRIEHLGSRTRAEVEVEVKAEAVRLAVAHGAKRETVQIADFDMIPVQDMTNDVVRIIVKSVRFSTSTLRVCTDRVRLVN